MNRIVSDVTMTKIALIVIPLTIYIKKIVLTHVQKKLSHHPMIMFVYHVNKDVKLVEIPKNVTHAQINLTCIEVSVKEVALIDIMKTKFLINVTHVINNV